MRRIIPFIAVLLILITSFSFKQQSAYADPQHTKTLLAQVGVTPTVYCVGGSAQPPCATIAPSDPAITITETTMPSVAPSDTTTPSAAPSEATPIQSTPTVDPCSEESSITSAMHSKHHRKHGGKHHGGRGMLEQFFKWLFELFKQFMGGGGQPNPDDPEPTTAPEPSVPVTEEPTPTESPCTSPTAGEQPSSAPSEQPSNTPSEIPNPTIGLVTPTPTIFNTTPVPTGSQNGSGTEASVEITYYGAYDNDPKGSKAISDPVKHQEAGGVGTYADPLTFASPDGSGAYKVGQIIYVPGVQKYFIKEDTCATSWTAPNGCGAVSHVDLYVGNPSDSQSVVQCENSLTTDGNATIIIDPPANLTVDPNPIWDQASGKCMALHT